LKGVLYGVGVGPGDPKLLTIKAAEILTQVKIIAVPDTGGEKMAMNIVSPYIQGKDIIYCPMPMTKDRSLLKQSHEKSAQMICDILERGMDVAFITLGDPSIYSTYMYVHRLVCEKGYKAVIIPGIPSFCAAAAALNTSLCEGSDLLHIIPASYEDTDEMLKIKGNKILMKSGKKLTEVKESLKQLGLFEKAQMVELCSMENEKAYKNLSDAPDSAGYFTIILVKEES
jgi:precorrin-2/cobalt-factor-2 C20-methyltransferase